MSLTPPAVGQPDPVVLSTATDDILALSAYSGGTGGSSTWAGANMAMFVPVRLTGRHTYTKAFWVNGAAVAGNVDVGIYTLSGTTLTRVVASTAEAQANVSVMQVAASFTPTTIGPGLYYLAMSCTSSTAAFWRAAMQTGHILRLAGILSVTTGSPLPATATAASQSTPTTVPLFGFTEQAVI